MISAVGADLDAGGRIVAEGTPEQVAAAPGSRTAPYLAAALERRAALAD